MQKLGNILGPIMYSLLAVDSGAISSSGRPKIHFLPSILKKTQFSLLGVRKSRIT